MSNRRGLSEQEVAVFAKEKSSASRSLSSHRQAAIMSIEQPDKDELLENTLLNVQLDGLLTRREAEILKLIVAGKTNKKIAQEIYRTERTVEYHRHRLMRKLGAHSAADLVTRAITMGIV